MTTNLLIFPRFRAFDANGDPLSGGLLYTYAATTTDPLATYTTRAGNVANANPVVLDANGEADVWMAQGADYKFELRNSAGVVQWTEDNIPSPAEDDGTTAAAADAGGRLTLTSTTPVTTTDVTAATTVYYALQKSNAVPLWNGTGWITALIDTDELSQSTADNTKSPAAVAVDSIYDVFVWDDSGVLRATRGPPWTSDSARGTGAGTTELEKLNGRRVNKVSISNGPGARRGLYVGTIRSDGSAQINDSFAKRHVWNTYNRVRRPLKKLEATDTWTWNSATYRQANGSTANQVDVVVGLSQDAVRVQLLAHVGSTGSSLGAAAGIGLDSISATVASGRAFWISAALITNQDISAVYEGFPGIGRHYFSWMEKSQSTDAVTFFGDTGEDNTYGLTGEIWG